MKFFDSHAHLDDEKFDLDREELIDNLKKQDIAKVISAGYSLEATKKSIEISSKYDFIYSTCGISPNDVPDNYEDLDGILEKIENIIMENINKKVVAIGEIGLDYYWNKENKEIQKTAFIKQIGMANKFNLPIVIHTREAVDDTLEILRENEVKQKGVFHCCPLNRELVKQALDLGFYISFAGPVTFKNSKNANEIIQMVPLDKILIETDSPYLAPEPFRGTRNNSANVKYIAKKVAEVKELQLAEIAKITFENASRLFKI